jgi:hypothetical protein
VDFVGLFFGFPLGLPSFISSCGLGGMRTSAPIMRLTSCIAVGGFTMTIPDFPVRDLKLEAITKLAHEDWNLPKPKSAALEAVSISLRANIARVRFLMLLPTSIAGQMARTQRIHDLAELEVTKTLGEKDISSEARKQIDARHQEMAEDDKQNTLRMHGTPEWNSFVGNFHLSAARSLKGLTETPLGAFGFVEMLAAHVTGIWTAIETMFGDLWESALNSHPKTLASLNGKPRRIGGTNRETSSEHRGGNIPSFDPKSIPLYLVEMNNFDLRSSMGSLFRRQRRFEFTRLTSVREAYSCAFSEKYGKIDAALASKSFDALSAVRNLLVHKAGIVDAEYLKQSSFLNVPKAKIGKPIHLDGENVAELIGKAIASSRSLLTAVDDWLQQN